MALSITQLSSSAENGVELIYRGVTLRIARINSVKYKKALRKVMRPYKDAIDNDELDDELSDKLLCQSLAKAVLVGWDATTFPGNIAYTEELATDLLVTDLDCRDFVMKQAGDINNFIEADEEEVLGEQ